MLKLSPVSLSTATRACCLDCNTHWLFSHQRWIIHLRRILHLQNPSKLTEKQMGKVKADCPSKIKTLSRFKLRRIICLARIIQRITPLRRIICL